MYRFAIAFAVLSVVAAAPDFTDLTFEQYIEKYDKSYTGSEFTLRRRVWESRVDQIRAHNLRGSSYLRVVNEFTDRTEVELTKLLGLNKQVHFGRTRNVPLSPRAQRTTFPDSIDWSKLNATTAVKNQGGCGSCWAFAGTSSIESCGFLGSDKLVTLSPQQYVDCVPNPQKCGGSGGCKGATPDLLFDYVKTAGAIPESLYPYEAADRKCRADGKKVSVSVGGWVDVKDNDYNSIMEAIEGQPITVGVAAGEWFSYGGGVFSFDDCDADVNHAVLLVGYGTDSKHGDYWKIQNSWGPSWGESGFMRLARSSSDSTNCLVDTTPLDGFGCEGGPSEVTVCGTCGILYGASYPIDCKVL